MVIGTQTAYNCQRALPIVPHERLTNDEVVHIRAFFIFAFLV